jgi:hypothetical protein
MKIHKFEVYVLDFEDHGPEEYETMIKDEIDFATVFHLGSSKKIKFDDDHELNQDTATIETWRKYVIC